MPDLSTASIDLWLAKHGSQAFPEASVGPENHPDVSPAVARLGAALDAAHAQSVPETRSVLGDPATLDHLKTVMAHIGPARRLRLLFWLSDSGFNNPREIVEHLTEAASDGSGQSTRQWLLDMHRHDLLAAIFDQNRINMLLAACRDAAQPESP